MDMNSVFLFTFLLTPVHLYVSHFNETRQQLTLCKPIICKGQIKFCTANFTNDKCEKCPPGSYFLDSLNSSLFDNDKSVIGCIERGPWSCPPETRFLDVSTDSGDICECDTSRGYYGRDFRLCRTGKVCPAGEELHQDGLCKPCLSGYYKVSEGYGPCVAVTDCTKLHRVQIRNGSSTSDSKCGGAIKTTTTVTITRASVTFRTTNNMIDVDHMPVLRKKPDANNHGERSELTADIGYSSQKNLYHSNYSEYLHLRDLTRNINEVRGQISGLSTWVYILIIFNIITITSVVFVVMVMAKYVRRKRNRKKSNESEEFTEILNLEDTKLPISCSDQNESLMRLQTESKAASVSETITVQNENV